MLLPTLWFRNTWSDGRRAATDHAGADRRLRGRDRLRADHDAVGPRFLYAADSPATLFCDNETNTERLFGEPNATRYVKDGIGEAVVHGNSEAAHPTGPGTKAAVHYESRWRPARRNASSCASPTSTRNPSVRRAVHSARDSRRPCRNAVSEADEFYADVLPDSLSDDAALVMRQALAGLLWSKQFYAYDVTKWLGGHGVTSRAAQRRSTLRNAAWFHMVNEDIISMPDKWEYPWYAAWDLAFHAVSLAVVDVDFAKGQLALMLDERYLHPNGQIPAYEWNFSDVNPPVHAWAVMRVYEAEKETRGTGDLRFLEEAFHKLSLNYTWWVNRKDPDGNNVFGGGFLGLDNIGVFDRSAPLPTGGHLEQADGTAWMAFYTLEMLEIALELARHDPSYQSMAGKFLEQYLWIAAAMDDPDDPEGSLWDDAGRLLLRRPGDTGRTHDAAEGAVAGRSTPPCGLRRPAPGGCAISCPSSWHACNGCATTDRSSPHGSPRWRSPGIEDRRLLSVLDETKLRRLLDADARRRPNSSATTASGRFRDYHRDNPFVVDVAGQEYRVDYLPAESNTGMFGGNSNWRGPIWLPMNFLLIRGLLALRLVLRRPVHDRIPHRLGSTSCRSGTSPSDLSERSDGHLPARRGRPPPGLRGHRGVPAESALERPDPVLRVFPR